MSDTGADDVCVVIEDGDLTDDEPGPSRAVFRPSACSDEATWFNFPFKRPSDQVINSDIPQEAVEKFQDLIWNKPHDRMVPGYGMTPRELACISKDGRKGWLVTSHFYWLSRCINQQQNHTRFFILDPVIRKASLEKLFSRKVCQEVKRLIFVMSVGRQDDGVVFLGTDKMQGDHWSVTVIDIQSRVLSYCDTLGWPVPEELLSAVVKYTNYLGVSQASQLSVRMAHQPNAEQHVCTPYCTNYPLQTCSDICGVIAMVCIAVAALDKELFEILMKPIDKNFNLFLMEPTEYASYLRHVLIYWLASGHVDISRISLKKSFNPLAGDKQTSSLKRKHDGSCNGGSSEKSKRQSIVHQYKGDGNINSYILEAMETGLSPDDLLSEVVDMFANDDTSSDTERLQNYFAHLTFNNAIERGKDDAMSSKSYIKDLMEVRNSNPVILFKTQGKEMKSLGVDDRIVAIQTPFQREMMKMYGKKCICMDLTKRAVGDQFYLVTVLVYYEGTDELPVAWLVSNRLDHVVLNLFVKALKVSVESLQTEVFIGDMGFSFYRAWIQHFPKPDKRMICMWEVLHVWNNRLNEFISVIKDRNYVKCCLSILPKISDQKAFKGYLQALLETLKPFNQFLDYFRNKFIEEGKDQHWASCYRHVPQFQNIPFLKPFSSNLKVLGFYNKHKLNRMDVYMHSLLQLIRFLENKLHIETSQARLQRALRDISERHHQPTDDLDIYQSGSGEEWYIRASAETNSFSIVESDQRDCSCHLKCAACKICIHSYVCSCTDYLLTPGSCKHIHFVHTYKRMNNVMNDSSVSSPSPACSDKMSTPKPGQDIAALRKETQKELELISSKMKKTQDSKVLQSMLEALRKCRKL